MGDTASIRKADAKAWLARLRNHRGEVILRLALTGRSPKWAAKRRAHIKTHPICALCGCQIRTRLNVHHIEPFHVRPDLELTDSNLLTLCEKSDAPLTQGLNCHQWVGHLGNWELANPRVRQWCVKFAKEISKSREQAKESK